jgi:hypothetical protein
VSVERRAEIHRCLQRDHGRVPGRKCGDCEFLVTVRDLEDHNRKHRRCRKADGREPLGPDWRSTLEACGLFVPLEVGDV